MLCLAAPDKPACATRATSFSSMLPTVTWGVGALCSAPCCILPPFPPTRLTHATHNPHHTTNPTHKQACGSAGTTAGLALGAKLSGLCADVQGYMVCDDEKYFYDTVNELYQQLGYTQEGGCMCVCVMFDVVAGLLGTLHQLLFESRHRLKFRQDTA